LEIALFGWATGQETCFHDHGGASGAAFLCGGTLIEEVVEVVDGLVVRRHTHTRRAESAFRVRHDPENGVALSIHAYTPAVADALDYDVGPDGRIRLLESIPELLPAGGR
jgi:hypothetical protein